MAAPPCRDLAGGPRQLKGYKTTPQPALLADRLCLNLCRLPLSHHGPTPILPTIRPGIFVTSDGIWGRIGTIREYLFFLKRAMNGFYQELARMPLRANSISSAPSPIFYLRYPRSRSRTKSSANYSIKTSPKGSSTRFSGRLSDSFTLFSIGFYARGP